MVEELLPFHLKMSFCVPSGVVYVVDIVMVWERGRSVGVQTTVITCGCEGMDLVTSSRWRCVGWVVRGRVDTMLTVTSLKTALLDERV